MSATEDWLERHFKVPDTSGRSKPSKPTECIHGIFANWCAICKHEDLPDIKQAIKEDNIELCERIRQWPPRTTLR